MFAGVFWLCWWRFWLLSVVGFDLLVLVCGLVVWFWLSVGFGCFLLGFWLTVSGFCWHFCCLFWWFWLFVVGFLLSICCSVSFSKYDCLCRVWC